jgi:hypothetical protein
MATIVENIASEKRFVLLGSSYSYFKDTWKNRFFFSNKFEEFEVISITDETGEIYFKNATEFRVVRIDGKTISEMLK